MNIDESQIRQWYDTMMVGRLVEIRLLTKDKGPTFSGIFDNADSIIRELRSFPEKTVVKGVYYTLNPLKDYCREWPQFGKIIQAGKTTNDNDIQKRSWLLIDIDPKRPSGINATEDEKAKAHTVADSIFRLYSIDIPSIEYFPNPKIIIDSGNGYHLLWRCDMENTSESTQIVRGFLQTLNTKFGTADADVDTSVHNASRISKLPGTWARKGDNTTERPHRLSKILSIIPDDNCDIVILEDLRAVIDYYTPKVDTTKETPIDGSNMHEKANISTTLQSVEYCIDKLEARGTQFPANRDKWLELTAGMYHSLGPDGLPLYLRFSALWENNDPQEDERKYREFAKYHREHGGATIASFFSFCRDQGVTLPTATKGWRTALFDVTKEIAKPDPLLSCGGGMIVSRENLCVITGKPKACKTTLPSAMVASCMKGGRVLNFDAPKPLRILLADTEQAPYHLKRQCDRAFRLAGLESGQYDGIIILNLRPYTPADRYAYIIDAIGEVLPDIVFIDGASDLITDTNDLQQSEALVSNLLTITSRYGCGIVTIVHTNSGNNEKIRGHIGSTLERKCESSLLLTREGMGDIIKISPKEVRNRPFEPFFITLDEHGDPKLTSDDAASSAWEKLTILMEPGRFYRHKELIALLIEKGYTETNAKNAITTAATRDRIIKQEEGYIVKTIDEVS